MPPPQFNLEPIVPKKRITPGTKAILAKLTLALNQFALGVINRQSLYPPQRGGSTYRRTGEYGRRWTKRGPSLSGADLVVVAGTNLSYAGYVGGFLKKPPRQTKVAARAGWTSVQDSAQAEWKVVGPLIRKVMSG